MVRKYKAIKSKLVNVCRRELRSINNSFIFKERRLFQVL